VWIETSFWYNLVAIEKKFEWLKVPSGDRLFTDRKILPALKTAIILQKVTVEALRGNI